MFFPLLLLIIDGLLLAAAVYFIYESQREHETRAVKVASITAAVLIIFALLIFFLPISRIPLSVLFTAIIAYTIACFIPDPAAKKAPGTQIFIKGRPVRVDERDIPFARVRSLTPGTQIYRYYYDQHPQLEEHDLQRRQKGLLGNPGSIDNCYQPLVAMMKATFSLPGFLGPHAAAGPLEEASHNLTPEKATQIVKNYAEHLGADLVGICRVNPLWVYSRRGEIHYNNWDEWGREITGIPPYAVVICTEMKKDHVDTAPHTPSLAESGANYAKGAYISTILAHWFAHMGYKGVAEHNRHYDLLMPPLAVDAGLGEIGRMGYLIAPVFGPRVRVFAALTDMPLIADEPVNLGVEEFCSRCKKCADSCPSKSIPFGEKSLYNGIEKWKINEDTCFDYWSRTGTDCCVCMAVCPYSRPDAYLHKIVRRCVASSWVAQRTFAYADNFIYGKKRRSKPFPAWQKPNA